MDLERTKYNPEALPMAAVVLIAANVLYFFIAEIFGSTQESSVLLRFGALYTPYVQENGEYWRLLTAMFLHAGIRHLLNNMLTLYVLSVVLLPAIGTGKYLFLYFAGGLAGNIAEYAESIYEGEGVLAVGASGAVFSVMGALLAVLIRSKGNVRGMSLRRMLIFAVLSVYFGFASAGTANTAHLTGLVSGFLFGLILYRKPEEPAVQGGE